MTPRLDAVAADAAAAFRRVAEAAAACPDDDLPALEAAADAVDAALAALPAALDPYLREWDRSGSEARLRHRAARRALDEAAERAATAHAGLLARAVATRGALRERIAGLDRMAYAARRYAAAHDAAGGHPDR